MEGGRVDADAPLDYAAFQIFPAENRYEAFVHSGNKVEKFATGAVEQLLPHLPEVKSLYLKRSDAKFVLQPPKNLNCAAWFTKSTLNRFLSIVGSPDLINNINGIKNEMCQLEETRKFQLSLYSRGRQEGSGSRETDGSDSTNVASSDASKNELLRAMDLRLTALRKELPAAFDQAMGPTRSEQITDLTEFSHHFGATELEDCLRKFLELNQNRNIPDTRKDNKTSFRSDSKNVKLNKPDIKTQISKPVHSVDAVKYGVSPAKLAEVERESSVESDGSSDQSDEEQKSVERSRTLIRSASPRRSASPMRRVQIGRSGSRRATAITIKSLNLFPARERTSHGDSSDEDGGTEQPTKKTEGHIRRMSVADAISLFERKQNDQTTDTQKGSSTNIAVSANKSVLRRWSTGLGESSTRAEHDIASEDSFPLNSNNEESLKISAEVNSESDFISKGHDHVEAAEEVKSEISEKKEDSDSNSVDDQAETNTSQQEEINEKVTASSEWSRQKEAELNQMLIKMMETKPTKYNKLQNSKTQNRPSEQRGGFYDHYKEKRDEKLRGETAGKRAEKEAQVKAMLQILDKRKTQIASSNASDGKKNIRKPQKSLSNVSQPANPKKETTQKPTVTKKVPSRSQSVPATRKSWPSTPSPRNTGTPAAKTSSPGTVPARRKPSPTPSVPQASPKVEKPLKQQRSVKKPETSNSKSLKTANEKKQQPVAKPGKLMKSKVATASGDGSSITPTKPSLYNKVTKKSSIVPLESKPFLRKGSKTPPGAGSIVEKPKKNPRMSDESLRKSGNFVEPQENLIVTDSISIPVAPNNEVNTEAPIFRDATVEAETTEVKVKDSHLESDEVEVIDEVVASNDDSFKDVTESSPKGEDNDDEEEESTISPMAWVEIEEQHELPKARDVGAPELASTATNGAPIGSSSPMRVRHSLSQMLQEESSEHDIIEWGNAENPPAMIYHKDAPKGLKRLLKFAARKSKGDANSSGFSSPSVFSEGEDDAEENKAASKRNGENLLRKAALHAAMNQGPPKASLHEGLERNSDSYEFLSAESNTSKFNAHKFHDSVSGSGPSAKATRSFFSLSAFRGSNKPNETKLR